MPRPALPGSVWIHTRIKLTDLEAEAFRAVEAQKAAGDAALVTLAVKSYLARVDPGVLKAYRALRGTKPPPPPRPRK